MPHLSITVDDRVIMDGDLGAWTTEPPELKTIIDQVKRKGMNAEEWMLDILNHVAKVGSGARSRRIVVTTRGDGYDLNVTYR